MKHTEVERDEDQHQKEDQDEQSLHQRPGFYGTRTPRRSLKQVRNALPLTYAGHESGHFPKTMSAWQDTPHGEDKANVQRDRSASAPHSDRAVSQVEHRCTASRPLYGRRLRSDVSARGRNRWCRGSADRRPATLLVGAFNKQTFQVTRKNVCNVVIGAVVIALPSSPHGVPAMRMDGLDL